MNWRTSLTQQASALWWRRYLSRNAAPGQELDQFRFLSPAEQRRILASRLLDQIRYFGRREDALPEWREASGIDNADELWRVWPSLPILRKQDLRERFDPVEIQTRFGLAGRVDATGGSTGEPVRFLHDPGMTSAAVAVEVFSRLRMGWRLGMPTICVWGSERDIDRTVSLRIRSHHRLLNELHVDGYNLSLQTAERVWEIIRRYGGLAIYGFTSMLEYVAEKTLEQGRTPPPGAVSVAWNGGEMLFPEQSRLFRRAFGVPLLNRYGGRELSVMACQSAELEPLAVLRPWLFLEVVDEAGRPVGPGQTGRLIWTSTICRGTPFLRYDIEDLGMFDAVHQDESGVTALRELDGRMAGLFELPDGRKVSCLFWNHLFKEFSAVHQFQIVLKKNGSIEILLAGQKLPPAQEAELSNTVRGFLRATPFRFTWVQKIPRTARGKLMQVVREGVGDSTLESGNGVS